MSGGLERVFGRRSGTNGRTVTIHHSQDSPEIRSQTHQPQSDAPAARREPFETASFSPFVTPIPFSVLDPRVASTKRSSRLLDATAAFPPVQMNEITLAVVRAVAERDGTRSVALSPLYEFADPDALEALFRSTQLGQMRAGEVTFDYAGYRVRVCCEADRVIAADVAELEANDEVPRQTGTLSDR